MDGSFWLAGWKQGPEGIMAAAFSINMNMKSPSDENTFKGRNFGAEADCAMV